MSHLPDDTYIITWIEEEAENAPGVDYTGMVELVINSFTETGSQSHDIQLISEEEYLERFYELERAFLGQS